jgi:hypothetical protein
MTNRIVQNTSFQNSILDSDSAGMRSVIQLRTG